MIRYIIFGIVLTASIVGWQLHSLNQKQVPEGQLDHVTVTQQQSSALSPSAPKEVFAQPSLNSNGNPNNTIVPQQQPKPEIAQTRPTSAWQEDTSAPIPPKRFSNKGIAPTPLKVSRQQIARATVGDTLTLPIPPVAQEYDMSVQQVGNHANGDKTLKGHLTNRPEYAVVVTQGQRSTYATVNTPEGSFLLEADQEQGWLMAATDLDSLIDPNLADYQIPDINRTPN